MLVCAGAERRERKRVGERKRRRERELEREGEFSAAKAVENM